jgi:hypothetical protein
VKQVRFFLFWIVIGVVLLIELGIATSLWLDEGPETAKKKLDTQYKLLTDLDRRAHNVPSFVFDPEKSEDIAKLTNDYLLTEKWEGALKPNVEIYGKQIAAIHAELADRSKILHEPILEGSDEDLFKWDETYKRQSAAVLDRLLKLNAVEIPEGVKVEDLEGNKSLRDVAGLYTKGVDSTSREQHAVITTRLRIIERIADIIAKSRAKVMPSPVVTTMAAPTEPIGTAIAGFTWAGEGAGGSSQIKALSGDAAKYADAITFKLTIQGPASAISAVEAALECYARPVMVVAGGSLGTRGNWRAGDRKDKPFEPMAASYDLVVLDFTKAATAASTTAGEQPK